MGGLALFYWIDRKNGFGGYWATQILPFRDPTSFGGYLDFETAAYSNRQVRAAAEGTCCAAASEEESTRRAAERLDPRAGA